MQVYEQQLLSDRGPKWKYRTIVERFDLMSNGFQNYYHHSCGFCFFSDQLQVCKIFVYTAHQYIILIGHQFKKKGSRLFSRIDLCSMCHRWLYNFSFFFLIQSQPTNRFRDCRSVSTKSYVNYMCITHTKIYIGKKMLKIYKKQKSNKSTIKIHKFASKSFSRINPTIYCRMIVLLFTFYSI